MPQLDPTYFISQLFWLSITFGTLYYFVAKVILPEIGSVLRQRQDRIQSDIEQAEKIKEEAQLLKMEYETNIRLAREESTKLIFAAHEEAKQKAIARHSELDTLLVEKLSDAEKSIIKTKEQAIDKFAPGSITIVQSILKKLASIELPHEKAGKEVRKLLKG